MAEKFLTDLNAKFEVKKEETGDASWILGFAIDKVLSDSGKFEGYKISSKAHIQKLMENLGLTDHDVANIPLNPQLTLPRLEEPEDG